MIGFIITYKDGSTKRYAYPTEAGAIQAFAHFLNKDDVAEINVLKVS